MFQRKKICFTLVTAFVLVTSSYAQDFRISGVLKSGEQVEIRYDSNTNDYYILMGSDSLDTLNNPVEMTLGINGIGSVIDTNYVDYMSETVFYRLLQIPTTNSLDCDGDTMADYFELTYPDCLNPLQSSDAGEDSDFDGIPNSAEYARGTAPNDSNSCCVALYVNAVTGDNENDGLSPTSTEGHGPKANIQSALADAYNDDVIEVAAGQYQEATLDKNVGVSIIPIGDVMVIPAN